MDTPTPPTIEPKPHPRVAAALAAAGIRHKIWRHGDCPAPVRSPADFAVCLGRPMEVITKTLFLELSPSAEFALAILPVNHRADLALLARRWNVSDVRLGRRSQLDAELGYPPTGVSPLGCGAFHVAIDEAVFTHLTVLVGGGAVGVEIEMAPGDLQRLCSATRLAFARP